MRLRNLARGLALAPLLFGCTDGGGEREADARQPVAVEVYGDDRLPSAEELERDRLDPSWKAAVQMDSGVAVHPEADPERWDSISAASANRGATVLPLGGDVAGPSVLRVQVLLDRALFSPGIIDGRWGANTEKAVYWMQEREGLPATGQVDSATLARLGELAGRPAEIVRAHRLSAENVKGPFVTLPDDVYERAKMECMCYESLTEKLSELFHLTPALLARLNPGVALDALQAGDSLLVPAVRDPAASLPGTVARLVISDRGRYLHALDDSGRILLHFPSTLGSSYDPSPTGKYTVTSITENPTWHYQPAILAHVPSSEPDAVLPGGPNNAVGAVWMALSKPHYGIHGTQAPQTIGYASSAGCVRLTNWDALFLSRRIRAGVPVEFRDTRG